MNHVVLVGGFWSCSEMLRPAEEAISKATDHDVEVFAFKDAMADRSQELRRASRDTLVITHSAGLVALHAEVQPAAVIAFNAPLPRLAANLILKSGLIAGEEAIGSIPGQSSSKNHRLFLRTSTDAILHNESRWANLRHLRQVAGFDSVIQAIDMNGNGIDTCLVYTTGDQFFLPEKRDILLARNSGIGITMRGGNHNEFLTSPEAVLEGIGLKEAIEDIAAGYRPETLLSYDS